MENPDGSYKVDALSQLKASGVKSRNGRRNELVIADKILRARNAATAQHEDPDSRMKMLTRTHSEIEKNKICVHRETGKNNLISERIN